jgi:hypothetical protein
MINKRKVLERERLLRERLWKEIRTGLEDAIATLGG